MHLQTLARRATSRFLPAAMAFMVLGGCLGTCQEPGDEESPGEPDASVAECAPWEEACDNRCVSTHSDPQHCGACGQACDTGQFCADGHCVDACEEPYTLCGGDCVSLSSASDHCGACGNECLSDGAAGTCWSGECDVWRCTDGRFDSDGDASNGCERRCTPLEVEDGERYDIELPVVHVDGTVTLGGESVPSDNPGYVRFESLDTESQVDVPAEVSGRFQAALYPGHYRVFWAEDEDCTTHSDTCTATLLKDAVHVSGDRSFELDGTKPATTTPQINVSGRIRVNGHDVADHPDGSARAVVRFQNSDEGFRVDVDAEGPALFNGTIPAGRYDVWIKGYNCPHSELPCQSMMVAEDEQIEEDTEFDWNLDSVRVGGQVTVNGAVLSGHAHSGVYGAIWLERTTFDTRDRPALFVLDAEDAGRFDGWVYPGTYAVGVVNRRGCTFSPEESATRQLPCTNKVLSDKQHIGPNHQMNFNLEVARLAGEVTVNGETMPDSPGGHNRGMLHFTDANGHPVEAAALGQSGPARFDIPVYPEEYGLRMDGRNDRSDEERRDERIIPEDSRKLGSVTAGSPQEISLDVTVYELRGTITIDGEPFVPSSDYRTANTQYTVATHPNNGSGGIDFPLEPEAPATFEMKVYGDREYSLWIQNNCRGRESETLPCGAQRLLAPFVPSEDVERNFALNPIQISGDILVNGEQPRGDLAFANLDFRSDDTRLQSQISVDEEGRFDFLGYAGTYEVSYEHVPLSCDNAIPCGEHAFDEPVELRAGETMTLDIPTVEILGDVGFAGSQASYPNANGVLVLTPDYAGYSVPVEDGSYGPVRVVDDTYHRVFQQLAPEDESTRRACTSTGDVPCHMYRADQCQ